MTSGISVSQGVHEQMRELTLARIQVMPDTLSVAVGSDNFTKHQLMDLVRSDDEIGRQFIEREIEFLRDLARGAIYAV